LCNINIFGYDKLSLFLDKNDKDLRCQNASYDSGEAQFIIVPRRNVLFYVPVEE